MPHKTEDFIKEHVLAHGISVVCGYSEEKRLNLNHMDCQDLNDITVQDVLLKYTGRMLKVSVNLQMVYRKEDSLWCCYSGKGWR